MRKNRKKILVPVQLPVLEGVFSDKVYNFVGNNLFNVLLFN